METKDFDKFANVIIRIFRLYMKLSEKHGKGSLGKWLIIVKDDPHRDWYKNLFWLRNIIGITHYKVHQDDNNSQNTACLCIYCGVNEKTVNPERQTNWILHVGKKLATSKYLKEISIRDTIYFKENTKTRHKIYSHTHEKVCDLMLAFKSQM